MGRARLALAGPQDAATTRTREYGMQFADPPGVIAHGSPRERCPSLVETEGFCPAKPGKSQERSSARCGAARDYELSVHVVLFFCYRKKICDDDVLDEQHKLIHLITKSGFHESLLAVRRFV
jgi:hypothetical protein